MYLDHNFTDASGSLSISLDIVNITTVASDIPNRFSGFGLGMTQAEAAAAGDLNDVNTNHTTMRGGGTSTGVCDFFVDTALDNNLRVWSNGVLLTTVNVGSYIGTIKVDFAIPDFNAGSLVTADVYFNGDLKTTQTFD